MLGQIGLVKLSKVKLGKDSFIKTRSAICRAYGEARQPNVSGPVKCVCLTGVWIIGLIYVVNIRDMVKHNLAGFCGLGSGSR